MVSEKAIMREVETRLRKLQEENSKRLDELAGSDQMLREEFYRVLKDFAASQRGEIDHLKNLIVEQLRKTLAEQIQAANAMQLQRLGECFAAASKSLRNTEP